ncbi:MAG: hypothetical protein OXF98_04870, partial [Rhodospirillaceae bacterium]|nr:hypothetical protein [Rhodospirillaceae bacterium]
MTPYRRTAAFVGQSAAVGLAVAFVVVLVRPDVVNLATRSSAPPSSYAGAVDASAPAVVSLRTARLGQRGRSATGVVDQRP